MPRRSRFEMYVDILTEIDRGTVLPTNIMYRTRLNWNSLKRNLDKLKAQGFIEEQPVEGSKKSKKSYILTERGDNVLNYLKEADKILAID